MHSNVLGVMLIKPKHSPERPQRANVSEHVLFNFRNKIMDIYVIREQGNRNNLILIFNPEPEVMISRLALIQRFHLALIDRGQ
jgi:hypothetical protein